MLTINYAILQGRPHFADWGEMQEQGGSQHCFSPQLQLLQHRMQLVSDCLTLIASCHSQVNAL